MTKEDRILKNKVSHLKSILRPVPIYLILPCETKEGEKVDVTMALFAALSGSEYFIEDPETGEQEYFCSFGGIYWRSEPVNKKLVDKYPEIYAVLRENNGNPYT